VPFFFPRPDPPSPVPCRTRVMGAFMSRRCPHCATLCRSPGAHPPRTPGTTVPDPHPSLQLQRVEPVPIYPIFLLCFDASSRSVPRSFLLPPPLTTPIFWLKLHHQAPLFPLSLLLATGAAPPCQNLRRSAGIHVEIITTAPSW
jgi:hypothetical protein